MTKGSILKQGGKLLAVGVHPILAPLFQTTVENENMYKRPLAGSFIESQCPSVCLSVYLFVPFHVLDFEAYFAPTSRSRMSKFLEIRNPWGKVLERSGLRIEHFCWEVV